MTTTILTAMVFVLAALSASLYAEIFRIKEREQLMSGHLRMLLKISIDTLERVNSNNEKFVSDIIKEEIFRLERVNNLLKNPEKIEPYHNQ